jgi:hypothetical protein
VSPAGKFLHEGFGRMREGAMPAIVQESAERYQKTLFPIEIQVPAHYRGKMQGSQGVLKPRMIGTRIDEIGKSQLTNVTESLKE